MTCSPCLLRSPLWDQPKSSLAVPGSFSAPMKGKAAARVEGLSLRPPPPAGRGFPRENNPPKPSPALLLPGGLGKGGSEGWECRGGRRWRSREQRPGPERHSGPALMWHSPGPIEIPAAPPRLAAIPRPARPRQRVQHPSLQQLCFCYGFFSGCFAVLIPLTLPRAVRPNLQARPPPPKKYPAISFPPAEILFLKKIISISLPFSLPLSPPNTTLLNKTFITTWI